MADGPCPRCMGDGFLLAGGFGRPTERKPCPDCQAPPCPALLYPAFGCILDEGHDGHHRAPRNPKIDRLAARELRSFDLIWWVDRPTRFHVEPPESATIG